MNLPRAVFPLCLLAAFTPAGAAERQTTHVIFISTDGLRWQDVFHGADDAMLNKEFGGVPEAAKLVAEFGGPTPAARREKLMPFLWSTIAKNGQIYGHRELGSTADVTNGFWFSYPGYSEFLTGHADGRIASNRPIPNPNVSVLEWLQSRPGFAGTVYAVNAWQVLPAILNIERSHLPMWTAGVKNGPEVMTPHLQQMERLMEEIPSPWPDEHYDAFVNQAALEILEARRPRVLYVNFGETDEWAHARRYDHYLHTARRVDGWIQGLWDAAQALPEYRGHTTLVVSTDHGRGVTPKDWISHGDPVPDSGQIWIAALGPDTPARGEHPQTAAVTQAQIAATLAAALGEDYPAGIPEAAPPIAEILGR